MACQKPVALIWRITYQKKVGTRNIRTYQMETDMTITAPNGQPVDPRLEALVTDLIGRVADKWTMIVIEVLAAQGELRFTALGQQIPGISQKMLTQELRDLEESGLVSRKVYPVGVGEPLRYAWGFSWRRKPW